MKIFDKLEAVSLPEGNYVVEESGLKYTATFNDDLVIEAAEIVLSHSDTFDFATKADVISKAQDFGWVVGARVASAK